MTGELRTLFKDGGLELVIEPGPSAPAAFSTGGGRKALIDAIQNRSDGTKWILIRGATAKTFSAADLPMRSDGDLPISGDLVEVIENCSVPVGFLAEGLVCGKAAEVFLAAHIRLASAGAGFAFASLASGRLPGSGATLRLTRSIGAEQALRLFRNGTRIAAGEALALGLLDQVLDAENGEDVLNLARGAMNEAEQPFPSLGRDHGIRDARACLQAIAAARKDVAGSQLPADHALIDCIEAALLLPSPQAVDFVFEREAEVAQSPEALALAHIHRAELGATRFPAALVKGDTATVRHLGLAGAEPLIAGFVFAALSRGLVVTVADPVRERLVVFLEKIAARQEAAVQAGRMTAAQRDADWARLSPVQDASALEPADLVLASAGGSVPQLGKSRPVLIVGKGDIPPKAMRLIVSGRMAELGVNGASPDVQTAWAFLRRMGLYVVITGPQARAGISGRLSNAGALAIRAMVEMGVDPIAIRSALTGFGQLISPVAPAEGVPSRAMDQDEIVGRWLAALANEGIRLMQAGVTKAASDIDLVAVAGMGFPRLRGGPLHQADQKGLLILRRDLLQWAKDGQVWSPVPGLDALVSSGRGFAGAVTPE